MKKRKIKTSIAIDEDLWREFSIAVIENEGHRKKNEVIERLIKEYVKKNRRR